MPTTTASDRIAQAHGYDSAAAAEAAAAESAALTARDARLDALVRREVAATCTALRMRLAAAAVPTLTPSGWFDLSLDVGSVAVPSAMVARRNAVEQAAGAMARSRPELAAAVMADLCGLSVEAWAASVEAEVTL
jgi:hypothetical protein